MNAKQRYKQAWQAVRLRLLAMQADANWDYTVYDGFRPTGEDDDPVVQVNRDGQTIQDWREAINEQLYEQQSQGEAAKQKLADLQVSPELEQLAAAHYNARKYAVDPYERGVWVRRDWQGGIMKRGGVRGYTFR